MAVRAAQGEAARCSFSATVAFVGERWTFLVLREALAGTTRFSEFRQALGIASDVLTCRLATLVEVGVLTRESYQEPGRRVRESYHLTASGRRLSLVLAALQQWSDEHVPSPTEPAVVYRTAEGRPVSVSFVDDEGDPLGPDDVRLERTASHPAGPDAPPPRTG